MSTEQILILRDKRYISLQLHHTPWESTQKSEYVKAENSQIKFQLTTCRK